MILIWVCLFTTCHRMRVYSAPLLSRERGTDIIKSHAADSIGCVRYYSKLYPSINQLYLKISDLLEKACAIYLNCVSNDVPAKPTTDLIKEFKRSLESFQPGSLGEHVPIWPTFIAASASREKEDQEAFKMFLLRQHRRNGFHNIIEGLNYLEDIWARNLERDWTFSLPRLGVFVM